MPNRVIDERIVDKLLERPTDFFYDGDNDQMFRTWTIGPIIEHRDSSSADRASAKRKVEALRKKFVEGEDFQVERFNHWAVGWVEHLTYKVLDTKDDKKSVSKIAKHIARHG